MTTPYAPAPAGYTAADMLAWWRQRARMDTTAVSYFAACRTALSHVGTETDLREISTLSLNLDRLAAQAAAGCWAELPPASRHHERLRLRRAVRLFHAAIEQHGTEPAPTSRSGTAAVTRRAVPLLMDSAGEYDDSDSTAALISYLADDEAVTGYARKLLEAADLVANEVTPDSLATLACAVEALEAAVTRAGVTAERAPAVSAALTAHVHHLGRA
jgi:hypothetical protein